MATIFGSSMTIALLQPSPDVFDLFDDVLLMAEGQIIYHGPAEEVMAYFFSYGFHVRA